MIHSEFSSCIFPVLEGSKMEARKGKQKALTLNRDYKRKLEFLPLQI